MLFVRFEDLTVQPKSVLKRIYDFLAVPEFQHDFDNVEQATKEDDQVYGLPGLHEIKPKVAPVASDYLSVLGADGVRLIESNYGWYFSLFRYPLRSA